MFLIPVGEAVGLQMLGELSDNSSTLSSLDNSIIINSYKMMFITYKESGLWRPLNAPNWQSWGRSHEN